MVCKRLHTILVTFFVLMRQRKVFILTFAFDKRFFYKLYNY